VIACCGLEHVFRGYESASRELFDALSAHADITLCKGSGVRRKNEVVIPCLRRDFLERFMSPGRAFFLEQISFAIALVPYLILHKVDVVHYSEGRFGNAMARLIRLTGLKTKLIFSNGGPHRPALFRPEIFVHQVCEEYLNIALDYGIPAERMRLVPHGISPEKFRSHEGREAARERHGLPQDKFVILSLAALSCTHKRLDYLIQEIAALRDDSIFLCMAGQPTAETPHLRELANSLLPGRHIFLTVPRASVPGLLGAADLFVHASLREGFGMVLIEACSAGVPVICHNSGNFPWVMGDAAIYADMSQPGALASAVRDIVRDRDRLLHFSRLVRLRAENFRWEILVPRYMQMYESVAGL